MAKVKAKKKDLPKSKVPAKKVAKKVEKRHGGGKPKGCLMVTCRDGHNNFLLPGHERPCNVEGCRRTVKLMTAAAKAPKRAKAAA